MTPLRQKMIRELQLHRKSSRTVQAYVSALAQLTQHYGRSPDAISIEKVRDFLDYLITDPRRSRQGDVGDHPLPHDLNGLILHRERSQRALLGLLFDATSATLLKFGRDELGGQVGFPLVLHTCTSGCCRSSSGCRWSTGRSASCRRNVRGGSAGTRRTRRWRRCGS